MKSIVYELLAVFQRENRDVLSLKFLNENYPKSTPSLRRACEELTLEGYMKSTTGATRELTKKGFALLKTLDQVEVVETRRRPAKSTKRQEIGAQSVDVVQKLNVSVSADALMNNVSALVAENDALRQLLMRIYNDIDVVLQLSAKESE